MHFWFLQNEKADDTCLARVSHSVALWQCVLLALAVVTVTLPHHLICPDILFHYG
jgi:hypothetical protein